MSLGFGHRARVGHLYPSGGLCDYEIQSMAPEGVQFVTTRLPFRRTGIQDDLRLADNLEGAVGLVADAQVDLVAFNCTAASLLLGADTIRARVAAATGLSCVTTIEAVYDALAGLDVTRVALVTPYPQEVVDLECSHLRENGIEVTAATGFPRDSPVAQAEIPPSTWKELALTADLGGADAVLFSCAGIQISPVIAEIECALGLPVVTSNQALLRSVLVTAGLDRDVPGYGRVLAPGSSLAVN
ncbi:arylmalonate decarboxylase [Gordonia desulfuricans]|uniref:Arylmalonate decarboxylase n=1 Tax=Gordonia desulfuricans TaxID=89051 RepID=A0A7K3LTA4_9ACTN|nr:aspartate/glutamate racemase family protein [Gordonia desulfuricans]NDK91515.1 arylmalonate decarboxylase [Gordonia desulfuricans]